MCPITLAVVTLAASIASTVIQQQQAEKAADAQEAFQNARFEQTQRNANASFLAQAAAENLRIQQEAEATSQQIQNTNTQKLRAQSSAVTSAGEAGVSGLSVDALLGEFERTAALKNEAARRNFGFSTQQSDLNKDGLAAQAQARAISVLPGPVNRPSRIAAGLQIASQITSSQTGLNQVVGTNPETGRSETLAQNLVR